MAEDLTHGESSPAAPAHTHMTPILLDGAALADRRAPALAERARAVTAARGRAPRVVLVAFEDAAGRAAYSARKVRAGRAVGVDAVPVVVPFGGDTATALDAMGRSLDAERTDAVFLEFPFPEGVDGDALTERIPAALDVDVMTEARTAAFMRGADPHPPLTAAAALALLDGYGVEVGGRSCAVIADDSPFARMFAEAFARRDASPALIVAPDAPDLAARVSRARIAIVSAGRPGFLPSSALPAGSVAIDVGYFNPGGRGDIDTAPGIGHLAAFSPVPGGIGPMTISALIERVVEFAERASRVK